MAMASDDVGEALPVALAAQRHVRAQRLHRIRHHRAGRSRHTTYIGNSYLCPARAPSLQTHNGLEITLMRRGRHCQ